MFRLNNVKLRRSCNQLYWHRVLYRNIAVIPCLETVRVRVYPSFIFERFCPQLNYAFEIIVCKMGNHFTHRWKRFPKQCNSRKPTPVKGLRVRIISPVGEYKRSRNAKSSAKSSLFLHVKNPAAHCWQTIGLYGNAAAIVRVCARSRNY